MRISDWSSDVCSSDLVLRAALDDPFAVMPRAGLDQSRHSPSKKREQPKLPPPSHSVDQDRSRTAEWASLLSMRRPYSSVSSIFSASPVLASGDRGRPSRV